MTSLANTINLETKIRNSRDFFPWVMFWSGLLGFLKGFLQYPVWHDAIEGSQIVAGIVRYPAPTPSYCYMMKAWTVLHQIPALFLKAGMTEIVLTSILTATACMLFYQFFAGCFYAFSGNPWLAIPIPFLFHYFFEVVSFESAYPIFIAGTTATYGITGLAYTLVTALIASQNYPKLAGLMLGIAPAIHPVLGLYTIFTLLPLILFLKTKPGRNQFLLFFLAGLGLCFASWFYHYFLQANTLSLPDLTPFSPAEYASYLNLNDSHRSPVTFINAELRANLIFLLMALMLFRSAKKSRDSVKFFLSSFLCLSTLFALLGAALTHLPLEKSLNSLIQIMPGRFFNYGVLCFFPVLFSLPFQKWNSQITDFLLLALIIASLGTAHFFPQSFRGFLFISTFILLAIIFLIPAFSRINMSFLPLECRTPEQLFSSALPFPAFFSNILKGLGMGAILITCLATPLNPSRPALKYWDNDAFLKKISQGKGILLVAHDVPGLIHVQARRPVLIHPGQVDILSYFPELGPLYRSTLQTFYGIDILKNPITELTRRNLWFWKRKTLQDWQIIRKDFSVTQIVTYKLKLQLPLIAESAEGLRLYQISE